MISELKDSDNFILFRAFYMFSMARCHALRADSVESIPLSGFNTIPEGWSTLLTKLKNHSELQAWK